MRRPSRITASAVLLLLAAAPSFAGVTIVQQESVSTGGGPASASDRTLMIEGNKEKTFDARQTMMIDLDAGAAIILNPAARSATQMPFPFRGAIAAMMQGMYGSGIVFQPTGVHRTLLGYTCDEYSGSGKLPTGDFSGSGCFSKDAPGATEYSAFYKQFGERIRGGPDSGVPAGIPLTLETTVKMTGVSIPGISPEQERALSEIASKQPAVVSSVKITSIKTGALPVTAFAIPEGYAIERLTAADLSGAPGSPPSP